MFSTYDGAKKCAKELCSVLERCSILLPLNRCQNAIAVAGGFRGWHDLSCSVASREPVERLSFQRRLFKSIPPSCRPPAAAWLDRLPIGADDSDLSPAFHRYTFHYLMATAACHRRTGMLRPGSGKGQKLRETIISELLISTWGKKAVPKLDSETLDLIYEGQLNDLIPDQVDHPRFEVELATLVAAGILRIDRNAVRVRCPDAARVNSRVESGRIWKLENWELSSGGETLEVLVDTLAFAGIPDPSALATALFNDKGSYEGSSVPKVVQVMAELSAAEQPAIREELHRIVKLVRPTSAMKLRRPLTPPPERMN